MGEADPEKRPVRLVAYPGRWGAGVELRRHRNGGITLVPVHPAGIADEDNPLVLDPYQVEWLVDMLAKGDRGPIMLGLVMLSTCALVMGIGLGFGLAWLLGT